MVKKFNLSVPDELARDIDSRREHLGSLSAIFQEAVAVRINRIKEFEERLKGDENMEATIERLKREKLEAQTDYYEKGREEGLRWAKAASYTDLEYAGKFDPVNTRGFYDPTIPLHDDRLGHYFIDMLEADPLTNPEADEDELNEFAKKWVQGWADAVKDFCREVLPKL